MISSFAEVTIPDCIFVALGSTHVVTRNPSKSWSQHPKSKTEQLGISNNLKDPSSNPNHCSKKKSNSSNKSKQMQTKKLNPNAPNHPIPLQISSRLYCAEDVARVPATVAIHWLDATGKNKKRSFFKATRPCFANLWVEKCWATMGMTSEWFKITVIANLNHFKGD